MATMVIGNANPAAVVNDCVYSNGKFYVLHLV